MEPSTELNHQSNAQRNRSSRRLRHEAEVEVFKHRAGDIENIRLKLGLRPSQICEILKVHPSAWTRWTKSKRAPPHIYQMLDWYVELLKWRGQNSSLQSDAVLTKKIRMETLETYLPEKEPFLKPNLTSKVDLSATDQNEKFNPHNYIEKRAFITILSLSFAFQFGLGVVMYLWLKHH